MKIFTPTAPITLGLLCAAMLLVSVSRAAERRLPFEALVIRVVDGDTLVVKHAADDLEERIRLAQIDAPESKQPHGPEARQALDDLVSGRVVRVEPITRDRYGRWVAEIHLGSQHINSRLVADGHSWVYRRYAVDPSLDRLEDEARSARLGLWGLTEPERLPPWVWRASRREAARHATKSPEVALPSRCDERRTCREMQSCREAMFFMTECGLSHLDGDRDGVPCERLCSRLSGEAED